MLGVYDLEVLGIRADGFGKTAGGQDPEAISEALPEPPDKFIGHSPVAFQDPGFHAFPGTPSEEGLGSLREGQRLREESGSLAKSLESELRTRDDHPPAEDPFGIDIVKGNGCSIVNNEDWKAVHFGGSVGIDLSVST